MAASGLLLFGVVPVGPTLATVVLSMSAMPGGSKIGGLKLEMPEKYIGSRMPVVSGWLLKMERYFRLMSYPANIWVDVIATHITDSAHTWLDKCLQDIQSGQRCPWTTWEDFT